MASSSRLQRLFLSFHMILFLTAMPSVLALPGKTKLFREYIGAENNGVKFSNVPVDPRIDEFHFILSFAVDYTTDPSHPKPTNGKFNVFWDTEHLNPSQVAAIKARHPNVKVAMSLGGDTVASKHAYFSPKSIDSWVENAFDSILQITKTYKLDGIDIDYEHFHTDPDTFAECIGKLLSYLKRRKIVSFTSIAPFDSEEVQPYYLALWKKYGHLIDYVDFQFYAYDKGTTINQFLKYFDEQSSNYKGGKILVSFGTDNSGGLSPEHGFFEACARLKRQGKLHGIFVWSADDSKKDSFRYERQSQSVLLAS